MNLPVSLFDAVAGMLRNEKPIYAYINSDYHSLNVLNTGSEPVGEFEDLLKELDDPSIGGPVSF